MFRVVWLAIGLSIFLPAVVAQDTAAERNVAQSIRAGARLSGQQAADLEGSLVRNPDNETARAQLLGYYFSPGSREPGIPAKIAARRKHILWLIGHHPDSILLGEPAATLDVSGHDLADPEGFGEAKRLWLSEAAKTTASAKILGNAGRFFLLSDKGLAAGYFGRARVLEPKEAMWVTAQANALAFGLVGITGMNQNGLPGPANATEANSAFARNTQAMLETSRDSDLLAAVAGELASRGSMAQTLARTKPRLNAADFAELLAKRAVAMQPERPEYHRILAGVYEQKAMTATSATEKKALAREQYDELAKATAGVVSAEQPGANEVMKLAGAASDAEDWTRAAALAVEALKQIRERHENAASSGQVDSIWHHAHLILGRAALRKGNLVEARANLLEAARVGGGGTLSSFGPNMKLAKELLEKGEQSTVLRYFELCRKFWTRPASLDLWTAEVGMGRIPSFGANLEY